MRLPGGELVWAVTGYGEVRTALSHPLLARDIGVGGGPELGAAGSMSEGVLRDRTLLLDGPPHTQLRRLAAKPLTARRVAALRPRIQELADDLIDALEEAGRPADLVAGLAYPLPITVICELLGVPARDSAGFRRWTDRMATVATIGDTTRDESLSALFEVLAYLGQRLEEKRAHPGEDLLSAWLAAQEGDDRLTDAEIVQLALSILFAGYESTASAIAASLWRLLHHPDRLRALCAGPELIPGAVQELIRYQTPALLFRVLVAREDFRLGGTRIRRGDSVMPLTWAANRDPSHFKDPDRFDIRRRDESHVVYGHGPHTCLGAALATAELEIAISTLLRRMPGLRPAVPLDALAWRTDRLPGGGLLTLPVHW
ncbi:cytochrome P450 [Streptomyces hiroshimensis]|uniref:Cytochrome P450 n=1 Tax=Streptomyces hiroshimensis TaxID=66424 RepID=A0ABQ2Z7U5_9ACTN|nr:cytochrome P450 [Streptomyces hiroshimensis]GGY07853.1 cytochrome P450 [Streptomyces hiroshimensis]